MTTPVAAASPAQPTVKTVQFTDPRIEPQPDPVYDYVIAPTQNQFYKIGSSSLSDSSIAFNNLTTLGVDRAYLDTFEIELTAEITFTVHQNTAGGGTNLLCPAPDEWTFDSFPFNKCCESIHTNINGGAFFSQPLSYLRAKERYMNQETLAKCYENVCPIRRPMLQYESGNTYRANVTSGARATQFCSDPAYSVDVDEHGAVTGLSWSMTEGVPTRYGIGMKGWHQSPEGMYGGFNNDIVKLGAASVNATGAVFLGNENYHFVRAANGDPDYNHVVVTVTWREPIFCSPFSSRYDATYGRPLYNITSMDITFTIQTPEKMIRIMHLHDAATYVTDYKVHFTHAALCYQVMTIPPIMKKPLTTLVPYRRFVPYITDFPAGATQNGTTLPGGTLAHCDISSGVYTFNEIPTAIWLFVAPSKKYLQTNGIDRAGTNTATNVLYNGNWDTNNLFGGIEHVSLTLANTTQILNTADPVDLYRIAKANGCQDSFLSWSGSPVLMPHTSGYNALDATKFTPANLIKPTYSMAGSVLRLIPGVDIIIPDQALIPGANANNMVFKADVRCSIPPHAGENGVGDDALSYSLWLLFEYVGVASISPGQCEITMNPLGSGEIMAASPIVSGTSDSSEGTLEGSGWMDKLVSGFKKAQHIAKETGIVPRILKLIPNDSVKKTGEWLEKYSPGTKRARGGAVMGKGLADWSV